MNLEPFCHKGNYRWLDISQPFNYLGFTWATDGRIIVRVPQQDVPPPFPRVPSPELVSSVWEAYPAPGRACWSILPVDSVPKVKRVKCEACGGSGIYVDVPCGECDGKRSIPKPVPCGLGNRVFSNLYLRIMIENLPHPIEVATGYGSKEMPLAFRFPGGQGLVMPMRSDTIPQVKVM
jgi:hypothetical protein